MEKIGQVVAIPEEEVGALEDLYGSVEDWLRAKAADGFGKTITSQFAKVEEITNEHHKHHKGRVFRISAMFAKPDEPDYENLFRRYLIAEHNGFHSEWGFERDKTFTPEELKIIGELRTRKL